jgi:hypothetical protein
MTPILETAIMEMGRKVGDQCFCPSEVVKWMFPQDWPHFMVDVQEVMMDLYRQGKISVTQSGKEIPKDRPPLGPVKIRVIH